MDENSLQNILPAPCAEEDKDTFLNSEEGEEENNELNNLDQYNQINCKQYQNYMNANQILFQQNRTFFQPPFHNQQNSFPPVINSHFINNSLSNNNYIAQHTYTQFFSSYDILGFCHEPQHTVATIDANPKEQNYYEDINSLNDN